MVKNLLKNSKELFSRQHTSILSAAFVIAVSYAASALLGLVRNRLLAARFFGGLESHLDVYFAAFVIPDTLFQLLVIGALSAAFIPIYSRYFDRGLKKANLLANATLNSILFLLLGLIAILFVFAPQVSNLIANFPPAETRLMANLIRLMLLSQVFFTVSTFLTGIIQSHRRFLIPALAPLLYNLGIILGILFLSPFVGIYGAAIGVVLGALLHMLVQIPLAIHLGYRYRLVLRPRHPGVIAIRQLMLPRTLALAASQFERWVATFIASLLSAGSLSMFNFARQLYLLPISLFGVSLGQASFPHLSTQASQKDLALFKSTLGQSLLQILFFALPASALLLVLRLPIVRLVFGARNFPWEATLLTGKTLALFSLSIAPQAATHVLVRGFYALADTLTPLIISLVAIILDLVLSYFLALKLGWGILGLSLAITIANLVSFICLIILLQKRTGSLSIYLPIFKMLAVSSFTAVSLWIPMRLLDQFVFDTTRTLPLIGLTAVASLLGLLVYFSLSYWFKIEQLAAVIKLIQKLGNWRAILSRSEVIEPHGSVPDS